MEQPLPGEIRQLVIDLIYDSQAAKRKAAIEKLAVLPVSYPQVVEALLVARDVDNDADIRRDAQAALGEPAHQAIYEQHREVIQQAVAERKAQLEKTRQKRIQYARLDEAFKAFKHFSRVLAVLLAVVTLALFALFTGQEVATAHDCHCGSFAALRAADGLSLMLSRLASLLPMTSQVGGAPTGPSTFAVYSSTSTPGPLLPTVIFVLLTLYHPALGLGAAGLGNLIMGTHQAAQYASETGPYGQVMLAQGNLTLVYGVLLLAGAGGVLLWYWTLQRQRSRLARS